MVVEGEHLLGFFDLFMGALMGALWGITVMLLHINDELVKIILLFFYFFLGYMILYYIHEKR